LAPIGQYIKTVWHMIGRSTIKMKGYMT